MRNNLLLIRISFVILFIIIVLSIVLLIYYFAGSKTPTQNGYLSHSLSVIQTNPMNGATNVPLSTVITVSFNRSINPIDIPITVSPNTNIGVTANDNVLTIHGTLVTGTTYVIRIGLSGISNLQNSYIFSFKTEGPAQATQPNTADPTLFQSIANSQLKSSPDVYLSNNTPYKYKTFSVNNNFVNDNAKGHWHFTVSLTGPTAKQDFTNWLHSLQLTDQEISTLDITYQ